VRVTEKSGASAAAISQVTVAASMSVSLGITDDVGSTDRVYTYVISTPQVRVMDNMSRLVIEPVDTTHVGHSDNAGRVVAELVN
jgi:hypothetical protein